MPRKPGFTRRQHVELGTALTAAHNAMVTAQVNLENAYPHNAKACRLAAKAVQALNNLACELDAVSATELPGDLWSVSIYYGNDDTRAAWLAANPITD